MVAYTANFRLAKPDFNTEGWDTTQNTNWDMIDSILGQFNTGLTIQGVWLNATLYTAGVTVIDSLNGHIWQLSTTYTSGAAPGTFAQDRTANPTFWTDITNPAISAAASAANALVSANSAAASLTTLTALFGGGSTGTGSIVLSSGPSVQNIILTGAAVISGTVSGSGINSLFASPPALGGTAPAAINGTTITATAAVNTVALTATGLITPSSTVGVKGTVTNDSAQAGSIGEYAEATLPGTNATVTITIAAPCVVTYTAHGMSVVGNFPVCFAVQFATTGTLPTGLAISTTYYATVIDANTFHLSTTPANALAGTYITTTGSQSGTQTCYLQAVMANNVANDVMAILLPAGDFDVSGAVSANAAGANTSMTVWTNSTSKTPPTLPYFGRVNQWLGSVTGLIPTLITGTSRYLNAAPTTVFLSMQAALASTGAAEGFIRVRRIR